MNSDIITQKKMINTIKSIPVEYFKWGTYPDHYKIEMPHQHQFSELLFFTSGGGTHEINFIDHEIKTRSIHFIPKSEVHFLKRDANSAGFTISFDSNFFEKNNIHKFINPLKHQSFTLDLTKDKFSIIIEQTTNILNQIKQDKSYYRQKCFLLSIELLLNTIAGVQKVGHCKVKSRPLVRDFKYLVKTNYQNHHTVSWYAEKLFVSAKYLSNQVKIDLDIAAKEYIQNKILISVKQQLLNTSKSIKQIAFYHQYDISTLGKLFKKRTGYSMSTYKSYEK